MQARRDALAGIAGTEAEKEAAREARDQAAKALYGKAFTADEQRLQVLQQQANANRNLQTGGIGGVGNAKIPLDPRVLAISDNPVVRSAAKEASVLAKTEGVDIGDPLLSLRGLHYIKLAIDNQLRKPVANSSLARHGDRALMSTKTRLMQAIEGTANQPGISPMYSAARETFADMSQPVNQMDVGQFLYDKLAATKAKKKKLKECLQEYANIKKSSNANLSSLSP
jgi:hypothetical protein